MAWQRAVCLKVILVFGPFQLRPLFDPVFVLCLCSAVKSFYLIIIGGQVGRRHARVVLALLFLQPGRHAGPGGDIDEICAAALAQGGGGGCSAVCAGLQCVGCGSAWR